MVGPIGSGSFLGDSPQKRHSHRPSGAGVIHELPSSGVKHDDQLDSTSQGAEWLAIGQKDMGLLYFYKREHEKMRARQRGEVVGD